MEDAFLLEACKVWDRLRAEEALLLEASRAWDRQRAEEAILLEACRARDRHQERELNPQRDGEAAAAADLEVELDALVEAGVRNNAVRES
jgi:hypothetical protein